MVYYVRYESDGTTYNDDDLNDDVLDLITKELDSILPSTSVSYNNITVTDEVISVDGGYEEVSTFVPLDEEELGGVTTDYKFTITQ